jgi:DNA polymerase-3 subunit beta
MHSRQIVVEISPGKLALRSEDYNIGQSEEVLPVSYTDETVRIGFNASYLADFLSRSDRKQVRFLFKNGESAAELQPDTGAEKADFRYVVMPMKIQEASSTVP